MTKYGAFSHGKLQAHWFRQVQVGLKPLERAMEQQHCSATWALSAKRHGDALSPCRDHSTGVTNYEHSTQVN
eukprot:6152963-Amphidinium_carterae.1